MKIIKYTHEQAVRDGELVVLAQLGAFPLYISKPALTRASLDGHYDMVGDAVTKLLNVSDKKRKPGLRVNLKRGYDLVFGLEIRDDDKTVTCLTIVLEGES